MSKYRKLNFDKVKFSNDIISYEEALKNVTPFKVPDEVISKQKKIKVMIKLQE